MAHSQRSSTRSATCRPPPEACGVRLEWRPSRCLLAALLLLTLLCPLAVLASEMPRAAAWPLAAAASLHGMRVLLRERARPRMSLVIVAADNRSTIDGRPVSGLHVRWRGPLAVVGWREHEGAARRLLFWPDVLTARLRRELRLAAPAAASALPTASMAP